MAYEEVVLTLEQVGRELEELGVRGLRAVGSERLARLGQMREEFERIGAGHLAERMRVLEQAIASDDRQAATALMRAQTSLRLFERVLTRDVVADRLAEMLGRDVNEDSADTDDAEDVA